MIVESNIAKDSLRQGLRGVEVVGIEDFSDTTVEAFNHAIGLRVSGFDEAVHDIVNLARFIKGMTPGGLPFTRGTETVGEFLAVVGKDFIDGKRCLVNQTAKKLIRGSRRLVVMDFDINPAG